MKKLPKDRLGSGESDASDVKTQRFFKVSFKFFFKVFFYSILNMNGINF